MTVEIFWYGHSCFRLRGREGAVVTDPYDPTVGPLPDSLRGDVVTVSHDHADHNYVRAVRGKPRQITGPGEYEINGIFITGASTFHDAKQGKERGKNTIYLIEFDDLRVCHLGDLGHVPTQSQIEGLDNVEVLLIPVGGGPTINAAEAAEVVSLFEPKIVIPMHYRTKLIGARLDPVDKFLKAMGSPEVTPLESFKITRSGLPQETQIILLEQKLQTGGADDKAD
jgi:L-ascorbate metabolism protein UlaG (beta-lactamase superfamily)